MSKIIGSMLIIVAGAGIGISEGVEMKRHLDALETLKRLFCLLKSELEYSHAPFDEVFEKLSEKFTIAFQVWLLNLSEMLRQKKENFVEIWKQTIWSDLKKSNLKKQDLNELEKLGCQLHYIESLNLYIEHLEYEIKKKREEYGPKRKLCQSIGIMGGIFLVILLL